MKHLLAISIMLAGCSTPVLKESYAPQDPLKIQEAEQTSQVAPLPHLKNNARIIADEHGRLKREFIVVNFTKDYVEGSLAERAQKNHDSKDELATAFKESELYYTARTCFGVSISADNNVSATLLKNWVFKIEKEQTFTSLTPFNSDKVPTAKADYARYKLRMITNHILCVDGEIARPFTVRAINQQANEEKVFVWN